MEIVKDEEVRCSECGSIVPKYSFSYDGLCDNCHDDRYCEDLD